MSKRVLMPIANDIDGYDAITIVDVLRRAEAEVTVASISDLRIRTASGVQWIADVLLSDCIQQEYDLIVLPGGMPGSEYLRDCKPLIKLLKAQQKSEKWVAAIGRSPVIVLQNHGLLKGVKATCYPSMLNQLKDKESDHKSVVVDQQCITGQGGSTAIAFAIT